MSATTTPDSTEPEPRPVRPAPPEPDDERSRSRPTHRSTSTTSGAAAADQYARTTLTPHHLDGAEQAPRPGSTSTDRSRSPRPGQPRPPEPTPSTRSTSTRTTARWSRRVRRHDGVDDHRDQYARSTSTTRSRSPRPQCPLGVICTTVQISPCEISGSLARELCRPRAT